MLTESEFEQMETAIEQMAKHVAMYYNELIAQNIPYALAEQLVLDYQNQLWETIRDKNRNA
jgi:hypothetical protein